MSAHVAASQGVAQERAAITLETTSVEQSVLALDILNRLGRYEAASNIEIGGGICLWHYVPYRRTNDVDARWAEPDEDSLVAIESVLKNVADDNGLDLSRRTQGSYQSWDLKKQGKMVFAFQIARKIRRIEPAVVSPWGHLVVGEGAYRLAKLVRIGRGACFFSIVRFQVVEQAE